MAGARAIGVADGLVAIRAEEVGLNEGLEFAPRGRRTGGEVETGLARVEGNLTVFSISVAVQGNRTRNQQLVKRAAHARAGVAVQQVGLDVAAELDRGSGTGQLERTWGGAGGHAVGGRDGLGGFGLLLLERRNAVLQRLDLRLQRLHVGRGVGAGGRHEASQAGADRHAEDFGLDGLGDQFFNVHRSLFL